MTAPRILEVTTRGLPWVGGVEMHVHRLSVAMTELGASVRVYAHTTLTGNRVPPAVESLDGVEYRRYPLPWAGHWSVPNLRLLRELRRAARTADAVHLHLYHQPLAAAAAIALSGVNVHVMVTPHYHGTGHTRSARLLHRLWRPTLGRMLMRRAHDVIAVSEPEADLLVQHFPFLQGRVHVIPNGIVPPAPALPVPVDPDTTVLLSVGRLEAYKGNDAVIRALPHAPGPVLFVVVGAGPDAERLQSLAADLGVEDRVWLAGRVGEDELNSWWARADAYVSLSEQEAFGLALGEALAAGIPAIVSDIPAYRYVAYLAVQQGAPAEAVTFTTGDGLREALASVRPRFAPVQVSRWSDAADTTMRLALRTVEKLACSTPRL